MKNAHYEMARFLARVLFTVMNLGCDVRGAGNLPKGEPYILALNHASLLDPPLIWAFFDDPVYFVVRREVHSLPVIGSASRLVGNIDVNRGSFNRSAIELCCDYLTVLRRNVGIFVEGTRSPDGEIHEPKNGPALLALQTGAPVVPAYIHGTYETWPKHALIPRWVPRLSINLGAVRRYARQEGMPSRDRLAEVSAEIATALNDLRSSVIGPRPQTPNSKLETPAPSA